MTRPVMVIEFDEAELACRLVEALNDEPRPSGSAYECLAMMDKPQRDAMIRAAGAAMRYFAEQFNVASRVQ